jgi:hypothetical protein
MGHSQYYPGTWYSDAVFNQSLSGAAYRWFATRYTSTDTGIQVGKRSDAWQPSTVKAIVYATELVLLLAAAWAIGWRRDRRSMDPNREPLEYGLVLTLMLLLSPMSSKPHFCILILPAFCIARRALQERRHWARTVLALVFIAGFIGTKGVWGADQSVIALWYGNVMCSAALLFVGCWVMLARPQATPAAAPNLLPRAA